MKRYNGYDRLRLSTAKGMLRTLCFILSGLCRFDSINMDTLWTIQVNIGCLPDMLWVFKQLHRETKGWLNINGSLSELITIDNGFKQGDIPAPILFFIFVGVSFTYAFQYCGVGVCTCVLGARVKFLIWLVSRLWIKDFPVNYCGPLFSYRKGHTTHNGPFYESMQCVLCLNLYFYVRVTIKDTPPQNLKFLFRVRVSRLLISLSTLEAFSP